MNDVAVLIALATSVTVGVSWRAITSRQRAEVWRSVAARRDATFSTSPGHLLSRHYEIVDRSRGVTVVLDWRDQGRRKVGSRLVTRARAWFPLPAGPVFRLAGNGMLSWLELATRGTRLTVGHASFDQSFRLDGDADGDVGACWTQRAIDLCLAELPELRIESDGRTVTLRYPGLLDRESRIEACLDVMAEIARADLFGLGALRALPGAREQGPTSVQLEGADAVELGVVLEDDRVCTFAAAELGRVVPDFAAEISTDGEPDDDLPAGLLTESSAHLLARLAGGCLSAADGQIAYWFDGVERERERLLAAAKLVASLARSSQGIYR